MLTNSNEKFIEKFQQNYPKPEHVIRRQWATCMRLADCLGTQMGSGQRSSCFFLVRRKNKFCSLLFSFSLFFIFRNTINITDFYQSKRQATKNSMLKHTL